MQAYLYVGLQARIFGAKSPQALELNNRRSLHCTLMYSAISGRRTPKMQCRQQTYTAEIISVAYIPHADCTCLILKNSRPLQARHDYFANFGFSLGYEFEPHITVSRGNSVCKWVELIGQHVDLSNEYFQLLMKEPNDPLKQQAYAKTKVTGFPS